jgi:hypothetical protein
MWACIEEALVRGLARCDLGRSNRTSSQAETKREWGGREQDLFYCVAVEPGRIEAGSAQESRSMRLASTLWKRLPLGLTRAIGPALARELP